MNNLRIETKNLSKKYGNDIVVNDISLKVKRNSIYGLLGPNGAGKSTTLKMIVGLIRPSSGEILFSDKPWTRKSMEKIGALIEAPALYENLTARENLLVQTTLLKLPKSRIDEVLEIVDLKDTGKKRLPNFPWE